MRSCLTAFSLLLLLAALVSSALAQPPKPSATKPPAPKATAKSAAKQVAPEPGGTQSATETANWWVKQVPSSGFEPADENPDFDKYMSISTPARTGKDGKFVRDELVAKGWDKTLRTFYMTLDVKPENPIRVSIPEIPTSLPAKGTKPKREPDVMQFHSDFKVLEVVDGDVLEGSGKVGLAVSMGGFGYIVGLPGSRLDVTAFTEKPLQLAGRKWRATSKDRAFMVITPTEILLENVSQVK